MGHIQGEVWLLDTGVDHHMSPYAWHFRELGISPLNCVDLAVEGHSLPVLGQGTVRLSSVGSSFDLPGVQYVPGLSAPLLSVWQLERQGYTVVLSESEHAVLDRSGVVVLEVERLTTCEGGGVYYLPYRAVDWSQACLSCGPAGRAHAVSGASTRRATGD